MYHSKYLVLHAVSMPVCCVYIHVVAHSHQVPVHFVTHLHVQTHQVPIHVPVDGCRHRDTFLRALKLHIIGLNAEVQFCTHVILTMHLVALFKVFIIFQVWTGAPDVGPDVLIQVPGNINIGYYQIPLI